VLMAGAAGAVAAVGTAVVLPNVRQLPAPSTHASTETNASLSPRIVPVVIQVGAQGGLPKTQSSAPLDVNVPFETQGYLSFSMETSAAACSDIRLRISGDERPVLTTNFFRGQLGQTELGTVAAGSHMLRLSPEGKPGGCNEGWLQSWGGKLTLYVSRQ